MNLWCLAVESLPALEQRLAERLLDFEFLDEAWPTGGTAMERAEIGWQRNGVLVEIAALQKSISFVPIEFLADVAV